jgi:RNA polymerase sigma-70 factor, ECF subfamily
MDSQSLRTDDSVEYILKKYSDMVFRVAFARTNNTQDSEDIMQEVFLRYIRSKPCFKNEEHEKAWFIRVTINCAKNLLTSSWFRRTTKLDDRLSVKLAEKSEVYYAVMSLPKDMRTVIHLYYYEDYDIREISVLLSRSESYVKSILMRARKKLKNVLEAEV